MFTRFMDMSSGGGRKEDFSHIYIEADSREQAEIIFYNRFGHNPNRVTCTCCGPDYSIDSEETIEMASAYDRGCEWGDNDYDLTTAKESVEQYESSKNILVIRSNEISDDERNGDLPQQESNV